MAYLALDTFCDKAAADKRVADYRKAGRKRVELFEVNGITVNDGLQFPPTAAFVQDADPLYVVLSEH